ncbi:hypothetical protein [Thermobifida halotolerans]|uniref:hypothetical protein n=1 Tax=Thermobifida halotolerans TaxID=483545 RepID=UPI0008394959|nr:hypothetical protein [Thermobifida halotolerans]
MPALHEIMNIFADKDGGGAHPPMPSVDEITGKPWLTHGRYHFAETDHIIKGFDFENIDIWWDWRETTSGYTTQAVTGGQIIVPYTSTKIDYAGYKIETQLWEGAESPEYKFNSGLIDLRNVAVVGTSVESTSYATSTHWKIAAVIAKMDDFFLEQQELLLKKVHTLFDKDAPIQGNAANMFANHLFNLGSRLENLSTQLDRFHNAVNNIRPRIIPAIADLADAIDARANGPYTSIHKIIYDWYNHQSNGTQRFNTARDQFEINYADGAWGIIGDSITDAGVNAELHRRWNLGLQPVINAANRLYDVMSEVYTDIATDIRPITNPTGKNLPGFSGPGNTGLNGPGGPGAGDLNLDIPDLNFETPEFNFETPEFDTSDLPPPTTVSGPGGGGGSGEGGAGAPCRR